MAGFQHDVAGGQGNLVVTSLQSPNFEAGSMGWQVAKNGNAEFNNAIIRGIVESGQFIGTGEGNEILIYTAAPAAGDLIASVSSTNDTDAEGNTVVDGLASYGPNAGRVQVAANQSTGIPYVIWVPPSAAHVSVPPQANAEAVTPGSTEYYQLTLTSGHPASGPTDASLVLLSENNTASLAANGALQIGGVTILGWDAAQIVPTVPIIYDTWHTIPMLTGWSAIGGSPVPSYRKLPDGNVQVCGVAGYTSSFTSGQAFAAAGSVPSPATTQRLPGSGSNAYGQVSTAGAITAEPFNASTSTSVVVLGGSYPTNL